MYTDWLTSEMCLISLPIPAIQPDGITEQRRPGVNQVISVFYRTIARGDEPRPVPLNTTAAQKPSNALKRSGSAEYILFVHESPEASGLHCIFLHHVTL